MEKLSIGEIKYNLKELKDWKLFGNKIAKEFHFKDFNEAMNFINKIAKEAEEEQHHPDILINYNKVTLTLSTHSVKGLTEKDFILAKIIEKLTKKRIS